MTKGYCMKCKKEVDMKNVILGTNARGAPVARGACGICGTGLYRILKKDSADGKAAVAAGPLPGSGKSRKSKSRKSGGCDDEDKKDGSEDPTVLGDAVKAGGKRRSKASKKSRKSKKGSKRGGSKKSGGKRRSKASKKASKKSSKSGRRRSRRSRRSRK
jgi:hypothetical protein